MLDARVARHCAELNRCNQRGGRMLSIFDLLEAGTLDLDLAAYLMARITEGASFMVGARPGGAGKTTVMCALLNLIPPDCEIVAATAAAVRDGSRTERRNGRPRLDGAVARRCCYVCHEIGSGPYFAYLWNSDLRAYCALSTKGHILATNLHADDLDEAREPVCGENRVPLSHFNAFHLALFLRMEGRFSGSRRWVEKVYASNGASAHTLLFDTKSKATHFREASEEISTRFKRCRVFLEKGLQGGVRSIEDTRTKLIEFLSGLRTD